MVQLERLRNESANWKGQPPARDSELKRLIEYFGTNLPVEYLNFLRFNNGGEGSLATQPVLFQLWSVDEATQANRDLNVGESLPNFMFFGSDGANELFALETNMADSKVFMIPIIVMSMEDAIVVAESFADFIEQIGISFSRG